MPKAGLVENLTSKTVNTRLDIIT